MSEQEAQAAAAAGGDTASRYPVPAGFRPLLESLARETLRNQPNDIYAFGALFFECLLQYKNEHNGKVPIGDPEEYSKFKALLREYADNRQLLAPKDVSAAAAAPAPGEHNEHCDGDAAPSEDKAATLIQAGFRQMHQRKQYLEMKDEMNTAATKIQANFRGFQTRKQVDSRGQSRASARSGDTPPGHPVAGDNASHEHGGETQAAPAADATAATAVPATGAAGGKGKRRGGRGKRWQQEEGVKWHVAKPKGQGQVPAAHQQPPPQQGNGQSHPAPADKQS